MSSQTTQNAAVGAAAQVKTHTVIVAPARQAHKRLRDPMPLMLAVTVLAAIIAYTVPGLGGHTRPMPTAAQTAAMATRQTAWLAGK